MHMISQNNSLQQCVYLGWIETMSHDMIALCRKPCIWAFLDFFDSPLTLMWMQKRQCGPEIREV